MRLSKIFCGTCVGLAGLLLCGCSQPKPEGPAERIGKGIDEIAGGLREYDRERTQNQNVDRYRQERARYAGCEGSDYYRNPRCQSDFSYDDNREGTRRDAYETYPSQDSRDRPSASDREADYGDDWDSRRRY